MDFSLHLQFVDNVYFQLLEKLITEKYLSIYFTLMKSICKGMYIYFWDSLQILLTVLEAVIYDIKFHDNLLAEIYMYAYMDLWIIAHYWQIHNKLKCMY